MGDNQIPASNYKIYFEDKEFSSLNKFLKNNSFSNIVVLTDTNVKKHCLSILSKAVSEVKQKNIICIKAGEIYKNLETCQFIWDKLNAFNCDRNSLLINVGGGVISDMGGFCASVYKRGFSFINVPTTCLSMADASVGGKTGIDYHNYKNQIGTFTEPEGVFIYPVFCKTQSKRELINGMAEVLKAGFIADKQLAKDVVAYQKNENEFASLLKQSVVIKNTIVEIDPKEKNIRKSLNFGHTIGHAIESFYLSKKNTLLHGEAIAIGMICESYVALKLNLLSEKDFLFVEDSVLHLFKKVKLDPKDFHAILKLMFHDKKNKAGKIKLALIEKPGKPKLDVECSNSLLEDALKYYTSIS
ncbi:MAG: 3-dehydroquinate synthase [Bacteroidota bacterium]|nr:3-dehydroquinate synthase [Bacteroidota bacterium]